ncbi:MAG TPA: hypothetical protein VLF21_01470 [Candidatus Saccharimonadales bacterium]|nr:hypothetical protein [Candidatus Saccharimonadales bacterium]
MWEILQKSRISLAAVGMCVFGTVLLIVYSNQIALLDLITRSAGIGQSELQRASKALVAGINHGPWLGWAGLALFWVSVVAVSYYAFTAVGRMVVGMRVRPTLEGELVTAGGWARKAGYIAAFLISTTVIFVWLVPASLSLSAAGFAGSWSKLVAAMLALVACLTAWWQSAHTTAYLIEGADGKV